MRPGATPGQAAGGAAQQRAANSGPQTPMGQTGELTYGPARQAPKTGPQSRPGPSGVSGAKGAPFT